jgi:nucleotide-binding universal stress UspA family protein
MTGPGDMDGSVEFVRRPVVVGVDGSESSDRALRWAADAAAQRLFPLLIVCAAWPRPGGGEAEAGSSAARFLERAEVDARLGRPGLDISTRFVADTSTNALIDLSDIASLVVVGNRGHGGFHDLLLGSTSLHTAMYGHCPVAVIRPAKPATVESAPSVGRVVVGVDGSPRSDRVLAFAFDHADRTSHDVTAVHAWQGPLTADPVAMVYVPASEEQRQRAERVLIDALAPWRERYPQVDVRGVTVEMPAAAALVQQSMGADLVVVGSRGVGGFTALVLGSAGHALIHHSGCPVIITHPRPE